jgi:hypothetical protein
MAKHKSVPCGITNCREEAGRWIPVGDDTLHLCLDHLLDLTNVDEDAGEIELVTDGKVNCVEVGVYPHIRPRTALARLRGYDSMNREAR